MKILNRLLALLIALVVGVAAWVYSGVYEVGADVPHWRVTHWILETLRDRSIAARMPPPSGVPSLDDKALIAEGAAHYSAMCTGCHLAPGMGESDSDLRVGLYPRPPILAEMAVGDPAEQFWVIKHGIKMSAMPAWGLSHEDQAIWGIVAFLQKLPKMSPEEYQNIVAAGGGHTHQHGAGDSHGEPGSAATKHDDFDEEGDRPAPADGEKQGPAKEPDKTKDLDRSKKGTDKHGTIDTTEATGGALYVHAEQSRSFPRSYRELPD